MDGGNLAREISKKRKFIQDGLRKAELHCFLARTLTQEGYAGMDMVSTSSQTTVSIYATQIDKVVGENNTRVRELNSLIRKRFNYAKDTLDILARKVPNRGLSAAVQAESLKYKLMNGFPVRMAANGVIRFVMKSGAKGIEVAVSGKIRAQRAKTMKFKDGYFISSGEPRRVFVDEAVRHVGLKQGVLGVKVRIMISHDPEGVLGPKRPLPDLVEIIEPKDVASS
jgi:small subunit ribosomal protein S3e